MVRVLLLLAVPSTELPSALKTLPLLTLTAALAVMVAPGAKAVAAFTCRVWLPLAPSTTFALAVIGPLAVMGAVEANAVAAFTVRV